MAGHAVTNCQLYNDSLNSGHRPSPSPSSTTRSRRRHHASPILGLIALLFSLLTGHEAESMPSTGPLTAAATGALASPAEAVSQLMLTEWNPLAGSPVLLHQSGGGQQQTCQRMDTIPSVLCSDMPYNYTTMPNYAGHQELGDAVAALDSFKLLMKSNCSSEQLHFFLCSAHLPMCTAVMPNDAVVVIPPCRPLCATVRAQCEPILREFRYTWPFNCTEFPEENVPDQMCMPGPEDPNAASTPPPAPAAVPATTTPAPLCPAPLNAYIHLNATERCAIHCNASFITSKDEKSYVDIFHGVLAGLAFLAIFLVATLFLCCGRRIPVRERPVFMILFCLLMVGTGYVVRLVGGRGVGCSDVTEAGETASVLVGTGALMETPGATCIAVFGLLFYFGLAGHVWWLCLTVMWFCAAVRGRGDEALRRLLRKLHVFAWTLPAILMFAGILRRMIDSDELTAICYIGQQSKLNLLLFVIVPQATVTLVGAAVLLIGYCQQNRHKCLDPSDKSSSSSSSKPMLSTYNKMALSHRDSVKSSHNERLLVLCTLFLPASFVVIGLYTTDWFHREEHSHYPDRIQVVLYFVRVVMQFVYGLVVAAWFCLTARRNLKKSPIQQTIVKPLVSPKPTVLMRPPPPPIFHPSPLGASLGLRKPMAAPPMENDYTGSVNGDGSSDFYNSIAASGPRSPNPTLVTASALSGYPPAPPLTNAALREKWCMDRMMEQQRLERTHTSKPSYCSAMPFESSI